MSRRYSSSSITKNSSNENAINSSVRYRNSSLDIPASINYRESKLSECNANSRNSVPQIQFEQQMSNKYDLTQSGLKDYCQPYEETVVCNHQNQPSYAQSEGYHSYVSSAESTPLTNRLRQESQLLQSQVYNWFQDFQSPTLNGTMNSNISNSTGNVRERSESHSSTETLKWLGSTSDVSVVSQATSNFSGSSQHIAHSFKVYAPQRQKSESVLYMDDDDSKLDAGHDDNLHRSSRSNSKLFPINTYIKPSLNESSSASSLSSLNSPESKSISQQWQTATVNRSNENINDHLTYLDPSKTNPIPNSALKALQKNAIKSYFERQQQSMRESKCNENSENGILSEPKTSQTISNNSDVIKNADVSLSQQQQHRIPSSDNQFNDIKNNLNKSISKNTFTSFCEIKTENYKIIQKGRGEYVKSTSMIDELVENNNDSTQTPPPPLPRKTCILRRTSSASEYSSIRDKMLHQNQHLSKDLLAPMILGKIISIDDWVPERPPKPRPSMSPPELLPPSIDTSINSIMKRDENSSKIQFENMKAESEKKFGNSPSRRNSFAGQSSLPSKVKSSNMPLSPPVVPMRPKITPTPIMTINSNSLANKIHQHTHSAQRAIVVKHTASDVKIQNQIPQQQQQTSPDVRLIARKRTHNSSNANMQRTPPPLKPRLRLPNSPNVQQTMPSHLKVQRYVQQTATVFQQNDKTPELENGNFNNNTNPFLENIPLEYQEEIPKCSNLPDLLPQTAKYNNSSYRHSFNNPQQRLSSDLEMGMHTAPVFNRNSLRLSFNAPVNSSVPLTSPLKPPQQQFSSSVSRSASNVQSPKYTSHSTIDLKMTKIIDPNLHTSDEFLEAYNAQRESCKELSNSLQSLPTVNEFDNKIAVVRKLNMVEITDNCLNNFIDMKNSFEEQPEKEACYEKSEKEIKDTTNEEEQRNFNVSVASPLSSSTSTIPIEVAESYNNVAENDEEVEKIFEKNEVPIKVQPVMQEIACQTDSLDTSLDEKINASSAISLQRAMSEDTDLENLSKDFVSQLSPSDKLHNILIPKSIKSAADYISDLFKINVTLRTTKDVSTSTLERTVTKNSLETLTPNSIYFSMSEPKAKLMTRYNREMTLINSDSCDFTKKKENLVERLGKKLKVLEAEQTILAEESLINDNLGHEVIFKVAQKLKPSDSSKFRSYVDDIGFITMLLLSLFGRLARIENALHTITEKNEDKKILENKRDKLLEQLDEAKNLKKDIDRRGLNLSKVLEKSLTNDEYADYEYFINMKAKLIVDSREIADKIKLGEEQLNALKSFVHSEC
ncbi:hypothetical protein PVAND_011494 [Polypedilum vanderplanki]|uniref:ASD2 domain-containing protein n=1 Tax=Polypedilum vanderplanki TaxID=319348 RepID=A0A9J6CK96_POLVA|nr:hypothetical protein PVAND_011494 [Polypedilum vanderplanki]